MAVVRAARRRTTLSLGAIDATVNLTARRWLFIDQGNAETQLPCLNCRRHARRPAANHHQVEGPAHGCLAPCCWLMRMPGLTVTMQPCCEG